MCGVLTILPAHTIPLSREIGAAPPTAGRLPLSSQRGTLEFGSLEWNQTVEAPESKFGGKKRESLINRLMASWTAKYSEFEELTREEEAAEKRAIDAAHRERDEEKKVRSSQPSVEIDRSAERAVMEMDTATKQAMCRRFNTEGAAFFREGMCVNARVARACARSLASARLPPCSQAHSPPRPHAFRAPQRTRGPRRYERAAKKYDASVVYFVYMFPDTEDEHAEQKRLHVQSHLNLAACHARLAQWKAVLSDCYQVLQQAPDSAKAHLRRAQAQRELHAFSEAKATLARARELASAEAADAAARRLLPAVDAEQRALREQISGYRQQSRVVSSAMFRFDGGDSGRSSSSSSSSGSGSGCSGSSGQSGASAAAEERPSVALRAALAASDERLRVLRAAALVSE